MREFLPRYWGDRRDEDWYLEAVQHAPQKASQLDALRARHPTLAVQLWEVDLGDDAAVRSVLDQIRGHERREAALLTEIWYEEVGGEG
ncbi:MAG: hypothetical protein KTR31_30675 [Myxococcales bacterium]|nr:hypothetical protein [Myxococcales bacterium]